LKEIADWYLKPYSTELIICGGDEYY